MPQPIPVPRFVVEQSYPRKVKAGSRSFSLREMGPDDRDAMVAFARALPESDLLFLRMDITQPEIVDEWIEALRSGRRFTILAEEDGRLAGYASLAGRGLSWTRHLADIRVIVDPSTRGSGLGGILAHDVFSVARDSGLTKIVAQMAREQEGAQKVFRRLGFTVESMLADWVIDREGRTHDLIVMSYDVTGLTDGS